jgi:uncharacterized repeat protein (TIGR01451 family)
MHQGIRWIWTAAAAALLASPSHAGNAQPGPDQLLIRHFTMAGITDVDLQTTLSDSPDPVNAGTTLTYASTLTNASANNASGVTWSLPLPANTTFLSLASDAGWSCTTPALGGTGTASCDAVALTALAVANFSLQVRVNIGTAVGTILTATASAGAGEVDTNPGNDSATTTSTVAAPLPRAELSMLISDAPDPVNAGANFVYTLTASNEGPDSASDAVVNLALPAEALFQSLNSPVGWSCSMPAIGASGVMNCTLASMPPGSAVFELTAQVAAATANGAVIIANAGITASGTELDTDDNTASANTTVAAPPGSQFVLSILDTPDPVIVGDDISYAITLASDLTDATDVSASFVLPAGLGLVSMSTAAPFSCSTPAIGSSGGISCASSGPLPAASYTWTLVATASTAQAAGSTILLNGSANGKSSGRPISSTAVASTLVISPATLNASKALVAPSTAPGAVIDYQIVISNTGVAAQGDHAGDEFVDVLPAALELQSVTASSGNAIADLMSNTVHWNGAIAAGGSITMTVTARIALATPASTVVSNQATIGFDADGNGSNESNALSDDPATGTAGDATQFTVLSPATLSASKRLLTATPSPGNALQYEIVISNSGPAAQIDNAGDELVDVLPAELVLIGATATSGTLTLDTPTRTLRWNGGVAAATSVTITVDANVPAGTPLGTVISNQATLSFDGDGDGSNEAVAVSDNPVTPAANDPTQFTLLSAAGLTATKSVSAPQPVAGAPLLYQIVLSNAGPAMQFDNPGDELTDVLPAELNLLSATASSGTVTIDVPSRTVHWNGALAASASVSISINASIAATAMSGNVIENQATLQFDADGNGSNEATAVTDDPATGAQGDASTGVANDPSAITVGAVVAVPGIDRFGLLLLGILIVFAGRVACRQRRLM